MHRITSIRRGGRTLVVLLALGTLVALVAPAAQADPWQLERPSQADGQVSGGMSDALDRYLANNPQSIPYEIDRFVANDRVHNLQPGVQPGPDALDRYLANNPTLLTDRFVSGDHSERIVGDSPFTVAATASGASSGLDWDTFGLGFGVGLAACAVIAAMVLSLRRRRALAHA